MSDESQTKGITAKVLEVVIRLGVVMALLVWSFKVISPFLNPLIWGSILAIAFYPLFKRTCARFGGRKKLVGGLFILCSIALLIVPSLMLVNQSIEGVQELAEEWKAGELKVPVPPEKVKEWPLIGEKLYAAWAGASENLAATVKKYSSQVAAIGTKLFEMMASGGAGILGLTFSLIIAGILMIHDDACIGFSQKLGTRLAGDSGKDLVKLATGTVRGVALGVVGTAMIQAILAAIGIVLMGIPLAGLWAFLVLLLAVIQLPPILVLAPLAMYSFTTHGPVPATIFAIWCLLISASDGILKPLLMGRNVEIPMLVILIGALGGMMLTGIVGLFVGGVVLALAYRLFIAWLNDQPLIDNEAEEEKSEA